MNENGMDRSSIKQVHECATSYTGMSLMNDLGTETNSLDPKLNFVPWITYNGVSTVYFCYLNRIYFKNNNSICRSTNSVKAYNTYISGMEARMARWVN